tara:strand:+ start:1918 stop:2349 length:432 start_codon:yes stop_codon:yes gene_type:complete
MTLSDEHEDELNEALSGMKGEHVTYCFEYTSGKFASNRSAAYRIAYGKKDGDDVKQQAYLLSKREDVKTLVALLSRMGDDRFLDFDNILASILEDPNEKASDRIAAFTALAKVHERITKKVEVTTRPMTRQDVLDEIARLEGS